MAAKSKHQGKVGKISCVLFDLDNTLIDTRAVDRKAVDKVKKYLCSQNVSPQEAQNIVDTYLQCFRRSPQDPSSQLHDLDSWRLILWTCALGLSRVQLRNKVFNVWKNSRLDNFVFPEKVGKMLLRLRERGIKTALITNGSSSTQWEKIDRLLQDETLYFDAIIVGGDYEKQKPDEAIFKAAFRKLGVNADDCIMVGDTLDTDILGGTKAGVKATVWIPSSHTQDDDSDDSHPTPDYVLDDVSELTRLINFES